MRIRSIKPEFWRSSDIAKLAVEDRLLFIALWSYVDDNGVGIDKLSAITADLFADDLESNPSETFARVSRGLQNLFEAGRIIRYEVDERSYLEINNWDKHQRIDKPNKPRFPSHSYNPSAIRESLARVSEKESSGTGEQRNRGTGEQGNRGAEIKDLLTGSADELPFEAEIIEDPTSKNRFEEFWKTYPRKVGKQKAIAKYKAATNRATPEEIIDGAQRLANDPNLPEQLYIPHATTWLERNGWEDEPLPVRFRTKSEERVEVGRGIAERTANRPKMINPFES